MPITYVDPNIALNAKAPNPMTSLAEMIGIARGAQAYQSGGIELQRQNQANDERIRLQEFMSNPENYQTDGRIDLDKINATVSKIAPYTAPEFIGKMTTLSNAQTNAISAKQNLTQDQRAMIASRFGIMGRMGIQNKDAYLREMDLLKEENPDNKDLHKLVDAYKTTWEHIPSGPHLPGMAIAGAQTLLTPAQQQGFNPTAQPFSTGNDVVQQTTTPSVGGQAPSITMGNAPLSQMQMPPGTTYQPTGKTDMNNQPTAFAFDKTGRLLGEVVIPRGTNTPLPPPAGGAAPGAPATPQAGTAPAQPGTPPPAAGPVSPDNAPTRLPAGETPDTWALSNNIRNNAANAAAQVPVQNFNSNQIIKLADEVIAGKGAEAFANLTGGYAALPWTTNNATNLNQLGHYMALQTASLANSAGIGGTDAGRALAGQVAGTTDWTADAIKSTARVNRALATGTKLFNDGVQNAFSKNKDPFAARDFQNKWTQTLGEDGVQAIQMLDLRANKDDAGARAFAEQIGGINSKKFSALEKKADEILRLIKGQQ